jgi:hypothetical protein
MVMRASRVGQPDIMTVAWYRTKKAPLLYITGWIIFLDSHSWHTLLLYNFVNKKLSILIYRSISYVEIVIYILASTNTTHPTNIITMVSRLPLQQHGFGESAHPTPGSLFGRGWTRLQ